MNYDNETPMNDKFLMADGSIRNANGQIVQSANEYWKQRYKQATPIPAKFLHADGTIDENIGGGGGGSGGGGATITKKLNAKEIRTSVESEQAVTPPEGYDGFSEITFTPGLLSEQIVTRNQTMEFGTDDAPYFPKKLTVSVPAPSNYTLEELSLDKDSEPVTISYADKVFVFLGKIESWGELVGIGGRSNDLLYENSVSIEAGGTIAGIVRNNPDTKTITYTPDTSYNMGSVTITKLII